MDIWYIVGLCLSPKSIAEIIFIHNDSKMVGLPWPLQNHSTQRYPLFLQGPLNFLFLGNQTMQMYGKFEGFPLYSNSALFGLVSYNDPLSWSRCITLNLAKRAAWKGSPQRLLRWCQILLSSQNNGVNKGRFWKRFGKRPPEPSTKRQFCLRVGVWIANRRWFSVWIIILFSIRSIRNIQFVVTKSRIGVQLPGPFFFGSHIYQF